MEHKLLDVSGERIGDAIRPHDRALMAYRVAEALIRNEHCGSVGWEHFGNLGTAAPRREHTLPQSARGGRDIYAPNIAVLDYLIEYVSQPQTILDFGCGIGNMVVLMRQLGFDAFGFDRWTQLPREAAQAFLASCGMEEYLLGEPGPEMPFPTILVCMGIRWTWLTEEDKRWIFRPSLQLLLRDPLYCAGPVDGYEHIAEYKDLLRVHKRG